MSTYVYCVVASARPPGLARVPAGVAGAERPRLLELDRGLAAVVATVPDKRYSESAINRGLADLDWVSTAAVAHEAVVEHFIAADAVLPMKLFTIFHSDERALEHLRRERARLAATAKRLSRHDEWGVRVLLDRTAAAADGERRARRGRAAGAATAGAAYLTRKKAQRDAIKELATRARETVGDLYDRLAAKARLARRRSGRELPGGDGPLLLDAAFLVPRSRSRAFRALAAREARALAPQGYGVSLTGPWPPYTFVQD